MERNRQDRKYPNANGAKTRRASMDKAFGVRFNQ
jgi:hypothetical protein